MQIQETHKRILTPDELRSFLQISRPTYYRYLSYGMPRLGGNRIRARFDVEEIITWLRKDNVGAQR